MDFFKRVYNKSWNLRLDIYLWWKRKHLKNHDFSIVSQNCIGGIISHDLHERFNSPTVNLWFKPEDFFTFIGDLDYYLNAEIIEAFEEEITYPIGRIYRGDSYITIYFMHYTSFPEAVEKWRERAGRIKKNNLFVVFEYPAIHDSVEEQEAVKRQFDAIPYENKIMITKQSGLSGDNIVQMGFYDELYYTGKIMKRKNKFSVKRYLDDYDYVSFLNAGRKEN